MGLDH